MPLDRRMRFRDLHTIRPERRTPNHRIVQFYSSVPNIGNYLPVAAIQAQIGATDTWCVHDPVDFDYVNANYRAAVIGGAGLLSRSFDRFWRDFAEKCSLPVIIWGVGVCVPDGMSIEEASSNKDAAASVASRAMLVNVRDDITATYLGRHEASVTPCPTITYVRRWSTTRHRRLVTLSKHPGLARDDDHSMMEGTLRRLGFEVRSTLNVQSRLRGVNDVLKRSYAGSDIVVTTRLHGAIIASGLSI